MATLSQLIESRLDKFKSIVYPLYPVRVCFGPINTDITSIHSKHRTKAGRGDKKCAKSKPLFLFDCVLFYVLSVIIKPYMDNPCF